mgnify:FL=1
MDLTLHKTKRFFQKVYISLSRYGTTQSHRKHNEYEKECVVICKVLINKRNTALLISPISNKRYIKSDDSQIFIIIESHQMTIVNHSYSYTIDIFGKTFERLSKMFDEEVEKRRNEMEREIRSNVKHSLTNIYENITNLKV